VTVVLTDDEHAALMVLAAGKKLTLTKMARQFILEQIKFENHCSVHLETRGLDVWAIRSDGTAIQVTNNGSIGEDA